MKSIVTGLILFVFAVSTSFAQLITADPAFPNRDDQVIITFNSSLGSGGLAGYTGDIYAHTGVITNNSSSGTDWKYVKAGWNENIPACKLTDLGNDLWELTIGPSIQDYYNVPDNETILQLAFVFRNDDGSLVGKTDVGGDIYYELSESGLNIRITIPDESPFIVELNDIIEIGGNSADADSILIYDNNELIYSSTESDFYFDIIASTYGKHLIKAIAKDDNSSVSDSIYYYVREEPTVEELPAGIKDGINYITDNSAILCLLAPEKEFIFVLGDFNNWEIEDEHAMKVTPDGLRHWVEINNLESGKEYVFQYFIDGEIRVGDPYADKVSDPWRDHEISNSTYPDLIEYPSEKTSGIATVLQTGQEPYQWQIDDFQNPETDEMIIYELLVRDFIAKHDFITLTDTLDYLQRLGVNVIELMPNNEFEGNSSWGYNPNYYFAPDKYYGPKNTFKAFVDECHSRGIAVFMDLVLNHSYGTNPMVLMYWNSELNRPASNNPWFNEQSNFTKPDAQWGNDFNHESLYTQQFVDSVNSYWINEYNIDGFRFDFTKGFGNNIKDGSDEWGSLYDADRIALLKRMADKIWEVKSDVAVIFEHLSVNDEEKELANHGILLWGKLTPEYNQATMGYIDGSDFEWISYKKRGWNEPNVVGYMESHDEERLMFKNLTFGAKNDETGYNVKDLTTALKRQELAANFFIPIPGPKMIWQFGEQGYDVSIEYNGRVGEKPPKWEYMDDWRRKNLYNVYSTLIELKKNKDVFSTTDFSLDLNNALKKIRLNSDEMDVVILGNFGIETDYIVPQFQDTGIWYEFWTGDSITVTNVNESVELEAGEYRLYTNVKLDKPEHVGIEESESTENMLNLFPNPSNGSITISYEYGLSAYQVFDISGKEVMGNSLNNNKSAVIVTSELNTGFYIIKTLSAQGRLLTNKFIVR
jgi:alpha amylase-like protein/type IX secretion system substrate protein